MRETTVERYLVKCVKEAGGLCEKHTSPGRRGPPDRDVLWPGGVVHWIETKAPRGIVAGHQKRDHARRRKLGHKVFVIVNKFMVLEYVLAYKAGLL